VDYVTECCVTNSKVDEEDLIDLLEDIMDQEFQTVCDDNSIKEISCLLIKYLKLLRDGNIEQIRTELALFPPCDIWIVAGRKINFISKPEDESSTDEDDDDMEGDSTGKIKVTSNTSAPSTSGSTMQVEEEDIDPGWTVVKGKRK
jgi:pre-rRNA-processing protein TSR2